jgi:aspartate aminotransferase-like enzyme
VYFDFTEYALAAAHDEVTNTPAVPIFFALDAQLPSIVAEGMPAAWARHAAMAAATYGWVADLRAGGIDLGILAPPDHRSPTVTVLVLPPGASGTAVARAVQERGYTIGTGYGKLKDTTIRIGHMGDHTVDGLRGCLEVVGDVIGRVVTQ